MERVPQRYVVVEGVIGVGKTTLVQQLGQRLGAREVLEEFESNPFLPRFYADREAHALSTQLFFLMSRFRQQERLAQGELFRPFTVADYLFAKDRIFAELTLAGAEMTIYDQLFEVLTPRVPRPDLVIYLRADIEVVLGRIAERGRDYEKDMDPGYIRDLGAAYDRFFARPQSAPVMVVDTGHVDLRREGPVLSAIEEAVRTGVIPSRLDERGPSATPSLFQP